MNRLTSLLPVRPVLKPALAFFATTFVTQFSGVFYSALQLEPSLAVSLLQPLVFLWAVCWWFEAETKHAKKRLPMDTGMLLCVAWFVWIPIYLIETRGMRGIWGLAGFIATLLAAWVAAITVILLIWP